MTVVDKSVTLDAVRAARDRISPPICATPLERSEYFSQRWHNEIFFKLENLHMTGSFKERGALNKLLLLADGQKRCGVIAASAGNHGQAVAYHAKRLGIPATIVMPVIAPIIKVENTRDYGARVVQAGANYDEAKSHAYELAETEGLIFIHGFDDPDIIAGQGTLGLELLAQNPELDVMLVPIGGGGLAAGLAVAAKESRPSIRIIGIQTQSVASYDAAADAGKPVEIVGRETIADGIAVRRIGDLPFELMQHYVDEVLTVIEDEIANAVLLLLEREKTLVEGAGAVGVAALQNKHVRLRNKKIAVILSGGNIDVNMLSRIIDKGLVKDGRLVKLRVKVPDYPGQLSRIVSVIAQARANILEVNHSRTFSQARVGETVIDLVLETRGREHAEQIYTALQQNDILVENYLSAKHG